MDWNIFFVLLTLILLVATSIAVCKRKETEAEGAPPDTPLLYVVAVQELRDTPVVTQSVPQAFKELSQIVLKKQLYIYGESVAESVPGNSSGAAV